MVDDPDAIWKPGYDGPPPITGFDSEIDEHPPTAPDTRLRRRRFGVVVALVALVSVGALVVVGPLGSSDEVARVAAADPSVFGGPAARRLPDVATTLWTIDLPHDGDHWVEVIRRDVVIAAVASESAPPATTQIVAFDAATGEQRWTLDFPAPSSDVAVVGAIDDVLVLERSDVADPIVVGIDLTSGETLWSADTAPNAGHIGLVGTPFMARLPSPPDRNVTLIEAASGRDVGTIVSDPAAGGRPAGWSTDQRGTWFVIEEGMVVGYELTSAVGEPVVIGPVDDVSTQRMVVGDRVAVVDDSGSLTFARSDTNGPQTAVAVSAEVPAPVRELTPVSDSDFVVSAPGSIAGVAVDGDTAGVTWSRREGVIVKHHPFVGGTLIEVATGGGGALQLVDGRTGRTVEQLTMVPGVLQALVVAGDGVVVVRSSDAGTRLAGIDLDGTERWSIPGSTPVLVGDRIVVRATAVDDDAERSTRQLRITAYGDVE